MRGWWKTGIIARPGRDSNPFVPSTVVVRRESWFIAEIQRTSTWSRFESCQVPVYNSLFKSCCTPSINHCKVLALSSKSFRRPEFKNPFSNFRGGIWAAGILLTFGVAIPVSGQDKVSWLPSQEFPVPWMEVFPLGWISPSPALGFILV